MEEIFYNIWMSRQILFLSISMFFVENTLYVKRTSSISKKKWASVTFVLRN